MIEPHEGLCQHDDDDGGDARDNEGQVEDPGEQSPRLRAALAIDGLPQDGNKGDTEGSAGEQCRKIVRDVVRGPENPHALEANDLVEEQGLAERQDLVGREEEAQQQRGAREERQTAACATSCPCTDRRPPPSSRP